MGTGPLLIASEVGMTQNVAMFSCVEVYPTVF